MAFATSPELATNPETNYVFLAGEKEEVRTFFGIQVKPGISRLNLLSIFLI